MIEPIFNRSLSELANVLESLAPLEAPLGRLGDAMLDCWSRRGKVLIAGNGGSAADAMHLAEELSVRFHKNRRALAAIALCDAAAITCCGNDFGYDHIFARQVEALGNPGDLFIGLTTSGNSPNVLRAVEAASRQQLRTVAFLGRDGGKLKGACDIELIVPTPSTARVQEVHKLLFHILCEWIDSKVE